MTVGRAEDLEWVGGGGCSGEGRDLGCGMGERRNGGGDGECGMLPNSKVHVW